MRYFAELSYNGTNYHGWQIQKNALGVQQVLNEALQTLLRHSVETVGSGRTDTGVHAQQLFAQFDTDRSEVCSYSWLYSLNRLLPRDIAVKIVHPVEPESNARFDATSRLYEYRVHFLKDPFFEGFSTYLRTIPDFDFMNVAARTLVREDDFSSFSKSRTQVKTNRCTILHAAWEQRASQWVFVIKADRFLRGMVRAVVGTLLLLGNGRMTLEEFEQVILTRDRKRAGMSVAAGGLYLCKTEYPYLQT